LICSPRPPAIGVTAHSSKCMILNTGESPLRLFAEALAG
jgi:hypothetical protein